jgi:Protein of unknown function (DUF4242)
MPRYLVERTFADGWDWTDANDRARREGIADSNACEGVTWVHSYVTPDRRHSFCIVESPSPQAVRAAARANGLPVDRITEVLFPHFSL